MPPGRLGAVVLIVILAAPVPWQTPAQRDPDPQALSVWVKTRPDLGAVGLPHLVLPAPQKVAAADRVRAQIARAQAKSAGGVSAREPARAATRAGVDPRVLVGPGTVYTVRSGDTLWDLARRAGVSVEALKAANGLVGDHLRIGQRLRIPGRVWRPAPPRRVAFLWPARGVLTSRFGWRWRRHHNGIDIATGYGTPIQAVRAGVVKYAGWSGGYGRLVVIDHGGFETWYGHAARILVRAGQAVTQGQRIATVGCSGACTGPHLHFEVRVGGRPVDPMRYLR